MVMLAALLTLHALFFAPLLVRAAVQRRARATAGLSSAVHVAERRGALLALTVHGAALLLLYLGIFIAVLGGHWLTPQTPTALAGLTMVAAAAAMVTWTARVFTSWRLRPEVDAGHRLCTSGPFSLVRHPIYAALDALAVGTALCVPTAPVLAAAVLLVLGGWLRARLEERVLLEAFGDSYRAYQRRVPRRFVPGLW
ncbi:MAG: isoprenylcysteine carboxylmethyltransferase family protein [Deltaproteobacteria bacterium]|nr:isoprenylcysteine carboxylmethyltransferase family protein [Deltaproteobacteria bacterium]